MVENSGTFHLRSDNLCYIVEECSELSDDWTVLAIRAGNGTWGGPGFASEDTAQNGLQNQQVYSTFTIREEDRSFYRLRIELIGHEE